MAGTSLKASTLKKNKLGGSLFVEFFFPPRLASSPAAVTPPCGAYWRLAHAALDEISGPCVILVGAIVQTC